MRWARLIRTGGGNVGVVIALAVTAVMVAALLLQAAVDDARSDRAAEQAARYYESSARIEAKYTCSYLSGTEKMQCRNRVFRGANHERRDYEYLHAQQGATIWARIMGQVSLFSLLFSLTGVIAIFISFDEQRRANRIARIQTGDAKRNAREALEHARNVTKTELRPYVFVDKITPEPVGERSFRIVVWLKNFGRTPARNIEAAVTTYVTRNVHKLRPVRVRADNIELGTAPPGGCRRAMTMLGFSQLEWDEPIYDGFHGVIRLKYTYTDDDGSNSFTESFDYVTDPQALVMEEPMFYLLTSTRIKRDKKLFDNQGDLIALMRRRRAKQRREAAKAKAKGAKENK